MKTTTYWRSFLLLILLGGLVGLLLGSFLTTVCGWTTAQTILPCGLAGGLIGWFWSYSITETTR